MKIRQGFVSNSSSASFIIGIPSKDKKQVLTTLYNNFEFIYFGKYYLKQAILKNFDFVKKLLDKAQKKYDESLKIPQKERLCGKENKWDPLNMEKNEIKRWKYRYDVEKESLNTLEKIDSEAEIELVEFGLRYYHISITPTYTKENLDSKEIIGYELSASVSLFNDYEDMPEVLRNLAGILTFVYKDLNCWVDDDD